MSSVKLITRRHKDRITAGRGGIEDDATSYLRDRISDAHPCSSNAEEVVLNESPRPVGQSRVGLVARSRMLLLRFTYRFVDRLKCECGTGLIDTSWRNCPFSGNPLPFMFRGLGSLLGIGRGCIRLIFLFPSLVRIVDE